MSSDAHLGGIGDTSPLTDVPADRYDVFRHPRRIRLLEILERDRRRSLAEVTTELLEREGEDVADGKRRHEVRIDLVHNHLPRLADHDLLEWDADVGVRLTGEPPVPPAAFRSLLERDCDVTDVLADVVDPVRLRILEELGDHGQPFPLENLAATLAATEPAAPVDEDRVAIQLHHSHVPALENAGLVTYDPDSGLLEATCDDED
ncbi:DUF7344 domain-containing protein [Halopiger goleimassiliensis]|uniref:DUF7344 domain-containing protein n=1 Tax=Halopiger goleimassiliensis TaxID=1293048 RepID=UPI0006775FEE|nr:hypothetical protein [Halopiger goleimassiliensis]